MSKHTPGPFVVRLDPSAVALKAIYTTREGRVFESVAVSVDPSLADIFACAPELLDNLKTMVAWMREYFHDELVCDHSVNLCGCSLRREVEAAESAIAKATGEGE